MTSEQKLHILKIMLMARHGDVLEQSLIRQGKGWFHIAGMGHEAFASIGLLMGKDDYAFPYYRDRAFVLAKGLDNLDLALSFFAKKDSSSAGRQLPGHFCDRNHNIFSLLSPVAAHWLPAAGAAWGIKLDKKQAIVYASVGEASMRQGDAYEAICFAKEHKLPILFVVQDGKVSISTYTEKMNPLNIGVLSKEDWKIVDGTNVLAVHQAAKEAIQSIRSGNGPAFLWCNVERLSSHSSADDHRKYRSPEELENISQKDPLSLYKQTLIQQGVTTLEEIETLDTQIKEAILADFQKAQQYPDPQAGEEMHNITGPLGKAATPPLQAGQSYRMADAINQTFHHTLSTHPHTYFFGEDIEDPLGGVFRLTKGLSHSFPGRVFNSPLAESTIVGLACGLAAYGKYPIFEIQFIDFIMPAWNQLVNNIANLRWRSNGQWQCPCILYAPYGGYLPAGGIWHSQAQEGAFAHFPGLHIVIPSTPEDASGLICSALNSPDPVLFLIPKHLMWEPQNTPTSLLPIPIGKASIRQTGSSLTLVAWGNCIDIAQKAIAEYPHPEHIELIDLRSIQPWDKETIITSLKKTKRLLVVQEDGADCSVGQMIITTLVGDPHLYTLLLAPPTLVSKNNVHIGFNPIYEYSALPDKERVLKAIQSILTQCIYKENSLPQFSDNQKDQTPPLGENEKQIENSHNTESLSSTLPLRVPNLGEGLRQAKIMFFLKKPGDSIKEGDPLCEIETDKAVFPIESPIQGTFKSWSVEPEDIVYVGQEIGILQPLSAQASAAPAPTQLPQIHSVNNRRGLSPEALQTIQGVLPASLSTTVNLSSIKNFRKGDNRKITPAMIASWSLTQALLKNPSFTCLSQGNVLSPPQPVFDLGVAVALEEDVLDVAIIPNANTLSWDQFIANYRRSIKEVKNGIRHSKSRAPLIMSSMGTYQVREGRPIVVPPAIAIVFMGDSFFECTPSPHNTPIFEEVSTLCITFDHRWANGAGAARFLNDIKKHMEHFNPLLN